MMTKTHEILRALKEKRIDPYQAREALTALRTSAVETTSTADTPRPEPIAVIGMSGRYAAPTSQRSGTFWSTARMGSAISRRTGGLQSREMTSSALGWVI